MRGMDLEDAFIRDALTHPVDPVPLLVFADWLEERGDERAEQVRRLAATRGQDGEPTGWSDLVSGAWPRFSGRPLAPEVLAIVRQVIRENMRLNHEHVGTHHLLLALLHPEGMPELLSSFGIKRAAADTVILRAAPSSPDVLCLSLPPRTPRLDAVAGFVLEEANALGHDAIRPEHLLLGLCRAAPCMATHVLRVLGVSPGSVCERVLTDLGRDPWPWLRAHPEVW
jgi:uncharacterized protein (TIGR02996 family)